MLEISPSYLNQIEHDVRPLTVAVLLRITEVFGVDATFFASQDDTRLVAELREVTHGPRPRHRRRPGRDRRHRQRPSRAGPGDGQPAPALPDHHHAAGRRHRGPVLRRQRQRRPSRCRTRRCATTSTSGRTTCTSSTPPPRISPSACGCTAATWPASSSDRLTPVHGVHIVRRIDLGDTVLHRYDPATKTLEIGSHLSSGQQVFKMAAELAYLEFGDLIDKLVDEGKFTSEESTHAGPARAGQLLRRGDGAAVRAVPRRRRELPLRRRAALGVLLGQLRDDRAPAVDAAAAVDARRAVLVRPRRPGGQHVEAAVRHRFSLLLQRRHLPAVERLRDVRQPRQDPGADRADARRPQLHVGGAHRRTPRVAIWSAGQDVRDRAGLRTSARTPARLLGGTGLVGRHRHTDRRGLPGLRARQLPAAGVPRARPRAGPRRAPQHGVALPGEAVSERDDPARIPPGRLPRARPDQLGDRQARRAGHPGAAVHLFNVLGQHKLLFLAWLPFSGDAARLLGKLPVSDAEVVILRVGHLRDCEYELQQHRRLARTPRHRTQTCRPRSSRDPTPTG